MKHDYHNNIFHNNIKIVWTNIITYNINNPRLTHLLYAEVIQQREIIQNNQAYWSYWVSEWVNEKFVAPMRNNTNHAWW